MSTPTPTIEDWRKRIDALDCKITELLSERTRYAIEIGKIKSGQGIAVIDPVRERDVIANALRGNTGPLTNEALQRIFEKVIEECRDAERRENPK